ncbi:hypothetical protein PVK06_022407 [Gossypium arboreum]|uniref:Nuclease HARBI1 n=1 Tax=Gossypium arboreum TaxID=29729 RepID=A0ABR0P8C4_GOSAR|nr:hypothetical protein PVK06_022407 [Gossypium arboreum]
MDRNRDQNAIVAAVASVLAFGILWIKILKTRKEITSHPRVNRDYERENYINSILYSGDQHYIDVIRMRPIAFFNLCDILSRNNLLQSTKSVNIREQVVIFLHIIGHNVRFRVIGSRYYRSIETVHRYFRVVLRAVLKLYKLVIKLLDESTPSEIRNNPRFYPYFKDCIGALDGTHVRASIPLSIQGRYRSRKGGTTQNVLAAITFDLKFSYVLAGWEGSAHDSRILSDALSRPRGLRIPEGKYYLVDAGYGIRNGYITPYRGVRYHLKEFSDQGPENAKELFNLRHSSLRITIERVFGILKKRFRVLDAEPFWNFQTQVDIVLACCIIHNHIMGVDPSDLLNQGLFEEPDSDLIIPTLTEREEREEAREWSAKRDEIAQTMWVDYMTRNIRMGKGNKEGTSKQFRWTKPMEHLFLEILAEEAQKGNKPSNSFKAVSINRVAKAISERFQVHCDAKHVENHLRTVKNQWQIICTIRGESGFGWDDNLKMITCDRATYDATVMAHKKYEPFLNKSIDHYDEMALVVGKDMATGSFARTFADIDLDDDNQDSVPVDCENEEVEEVRTKVSSSGTSKRKRKNTQESDVDEQIKFMGEQLGKIANALEQFTADKTPQLYEELMSMEEEGFDDDFLCSVFDYLVSHESEAKAFLVKNMHLDNVVIMWCTTNYAFG